MAFDAGDLRVQRLEVNGAPIEAQLAVHWNVERFLPRYAERFMDELAAEARVEYANHPLPGGRARDAVDPGGSAKRAVAKRPAATRTSERKPAARVPRRTARRPPARRASG